MRKAVRPAVGLSIPLLAAKLLIGVFYDQRFDPIEQIDFMDVSRPTV